MWERDAQMSIASGIKGSARLELLRSHRLGAFYEVFNRYCDGKAACGDVQVRAYKMKLLRRKRRRKVPQRGDNGL